MIPPVQRDAIGRVVKPCGHASRDALGCQECDDEKKREADDRHFQRGGGVTPAENERLQAAYARLFPQGEDQ